MDAIFSVYNFILPFLPSLEAVPYVGKAASILIMVIATIIGAAAGLGSCATALVGAWHSVQLFVAGLAMLPIPGFSKIQPAADWLKVKEAVITDFENGKLLPILNRLSALPLPKKSA